MTGGAGSYTMALSHYDPVPANIQQQLVAEFRPAAEERLTARAAGWIADGTSPRAAHSATPAPTDPRCRNG